MKKILSLFVLTVLLFSLSACGNAAPAPAPTPSSVTSAPPSAPSVNSTLPGGDLPSDAQTPSVPEAPHLDEAKLEIARACIGEEVSALYDAIGEPADSSYAPSCLKPGGEDGELYYDGFTVATFRENETEIVRDVNVNAG